ncbi:GntR family transcriptional regulator [Spongiactinospora sp. TRM90649]|uniref:GntR family transcriptional regulator n=1 Tax=Spongiactinospora sp. TRM90649 TaxID=3031114 RepID=UPI0023F9156C|nr:GntR family transcriptional regulator [Spongiactinospora sp. TRM90649]MDF5754011.1 GntR family transcriptional regulator [Spongiactinospora sp. TRM90649]
MASSDPVYLRIVEDLRRQIVDGTLAPGALIPSRAQLTRKYGVGETAARHALRVLAAEGLIVGRVGSGHYVRPRPVLLPLHRGRFLDHHAPLAADLQPYGLNVTWVWRVERSHASRAIAERLRMREAAPVVRARYLFRSNGKPIQLAFSYEPAELSQPMPEPGITAEGSDGRQSVIARMASVGVTVSEVVESIRTRIPEPAERDALDLPAGVNVLHIERTHLAGDRPVETGDIIVSGDRFRAVYTLPVRP